MRHGTQREQPAAKGCADWKEYTSDRDKARRPGRGNRWPERFLQVVNRLDLEKQRKLLEAKQMKYGELDFLSKSLKTMEKCRKIASRIIKGDKVPPQDERYLKDNDPDGYKLALVSRKPKKNPKEWESVLDEEDRMGGSESRGETATAAEPGGEGME